MLVEMYMYGYVCCLDAVWYYKLITSKVHIFLDVIINMYI